MNLTATSSGVSESRSPIVASAPASISSLAIASLVSGILGWTLMPVIGTIVAIITGHMARAEIRRSAGTMDGDGMAIAGLILGWTAIALSILALLAVILFFGGLAVLLGALGLSGQL